MAVTFEEVSTEIEPPPPASAPAPAAPAPDGAALAEQIEQTLRVRAERAARLCDR